MCFFKVVTLKGQSHPWRSKNVLSDLYFTNRSWGMHLSDPPPTYKYTGTVSSKSYCHYFFIVIEQSLTKRCLQRRKTKREHSRNNLTDVHTLWPKLCDEGVTWCRSGLCLIWRYPPKLSFGIRWVSIHWVVMEIEPLERCLKSTWIAIK